MGWASESITALLGKATFLYPTADAKRSFSFGWEIPPWFSHRPICHGERLGEFPISRRTPLSKNRPPPPVCLAAGVVAR
jgi:hypothetical protein